MQENKLSEGLKLEQASQCFSNFNVYTKSFEDLKNAD